MEKKLFEPLNKNNRSEKKNRERGFDVECRAAIKR